jgi:molybdopterin/thiamine biosynthesis adenylyltransferase
MRRSTTKGERKVERIKTASGSRIRTGSRLRSLRLAVVGCGRFGSLVVDHIAAYGVARLTLIDPNVMERHNLGEMVGELDATLQPPKAAALVVRVLRRRLGTDVTADQRARESPVMGRRLLAHWQPHQGVETETQ